MARVGVLPWPRSVAAIVPTSLRAGAWVVVPWPSLSASGVPVYLTGATNVAAVLADEQGGRFVAAGPDRRHATGRDECGGSDDCGSHHD